MKILFSKKYLRGLWEILWSVEVKRFYVEREDLIQLGAIEKSTNVFLLCGTFFRWDGQGFKYMINDYRGRLTYKDQVLGMAVFFDISRDIIINTGMDISKTGRAIRLYYILKEDAEKRSN